MNVLIISLIIVVSLFCLLSIVAIICNKNNKKELNNNPMEGKKTKFIKNDGEEENADGERGHLEAISDIRYRNKLYDISIKIIIDKVISFIGLLLLSPVLLIIIIAIKIDDPGPVFFSQKRIGKNKKYFKLHKFRSMKMNTPHDVPTHMLKNPEQYITKIGKILRKTSLDELPQIWDIFTGNMSIIGPRPALWNQDKLIALRDEYNANQVKPGLTGWAQINGRDELKLEKKAELDGEYVRKESLIFDIKCFFRTIFKVAKQDGIVEGKAKAKGK